MSGGIQLSADEAALVAAIKTKFPEGNSGIRRVTTDAQGDINVIIAEVTNKDAVEKAVSDAVASLRADNPIFPDVHIRYEGGEIRNA